MVLAQVLMKRGIVIVSLGPGRTDNVVRLCRNIRQFSPSIHIHVVTDVVRPLPQEGVTQQIVTLDRLQWLDSPRWGVRNCNVLSAEAVLSRAFDSYCVLNDDMRIVSSEWEKGFDLAERFGVCVPTNPRIYVKYNALGADASDADFNERDWGPGVAPAVNVSPLFVCADRPKAYELSRIWRQQLQHCLRGTLAFWQATWLTGTTPVYLPEQWCVGASNAAYFKNYKKRLRGQDVPVEPIMLHWGQEEVRRVFKEVE
jgi:hypothetical protein